MNLKNAGKHDYRYTFEDIRRMSHGRYACTNSEIFHLNDMSCYICGRKAEFLGIVNRTNKATERMIFYYICDDCLAMDHRK